jgi:hypothetical protein
LLKQFQQPTRVALHFHPAQHIFFGFGFDAKPAEQTLSARFINNNKYETLKNNRNKASRAVGGEMFFGLVWLFVLGVAFT